MNDWFAEGRCERVWRAFNEAPLKNQNYWFCDAPAPPIENVDDYVTQLQSNALSVCKECTSTFDDAVVRVVCAIADERMAEARVRARNYECDACDFPAYVRTHFPTPPHILYVKHRVAYDSREANLTRVICAKMGGAPFLRATVHKRKLALHAAGHALTTLPTKLLQRFLASPHGAARFRADLLAYLHAMQCAARQLFGDDSLPPPPHDEEPVRDEWHALDHTVKTEVRTSRIPNAGRGLFARCAFNAGDVVAEYNYAHVVDADEVRKLQEDNKHWHLVIGPSATTYYDGRRTSPLNPNRASFANSALHTNFTNNARLVCVPGKNGTAARVYLRATRAIVEDEEILIAYGAGYWRRKRKSDNDDGSDSDSDVVQYMHYDFEPRNVLYDGRHFHLIDYEHVARAPERVDFGAEIDALAARIISGEAALNSTTDSGASITIIKIK